MTTDGVAGHDAAADDATPEHELRAWQAQVRVRAVGREPPPPAPRWRRVVALAVALLLHAVLLVMLRIGMQPKAPEAVSAIEIRLIGDVAEPPLPQPAPLPPRAANNYVTPRVTRAAPPPPPAVDVPAAPTETPLHVFNPDGSIALPTEQPRNDALTASFTTPAPPADVAIMRHQRPLKVRPNHFAQNFRVHDQSALNDFVEEKLTFHQKFALPWGTQVECTEVYMLLALGGGCGWYTPYKYYVPTERWKPASALDEQ